MLLNTDFFSRNRLHLFWALGVCVAVLFGVAGYVYGWYPVAVVNGSPILYKSYQRSFSLTQQYYSFFNRDPAASMSGDELVYLIERAVWQGLIDDVLIKARLGEEMKSAEVSQKVFEKIIAAENDSEFRELFSRIVVSVSKEDMARYFFAPQARFQLLQARLQLEGKDIFSWLKVERKNARVKLFWGDIRWTENGIE